MSYIILNIKINKKEKKMKKQSKIQKAAINLKKAGYTHIYSIVKSVYNTTYVHVNEIDDVIKNGWTRAPKRAGFGWHGPVGVTYSEMSNNPGQYISRQDAYFYG